MISAFSRAFTQVLGEMGFENPRIEHTSIAMPASSYLCSLGFTGALKGYLVCAFEADELKTLAESLNQRFNMGQNLGDVAFMRESLAELANQMGGRCVMELAQNGLDCLITPPTVISGSGVETSIPHLDERSDWELDSGRGKFRLAVLSKKI